MELQHSNQQGQHLMPLQKSDWLQNFKAIQVTANSTQVDVLKVPAAELSTICRGTGSKENGYDLYQVVILMILEFYGVEWSDEQIRECAELLYDDYYWLTLAELKHFTLMAKSSKFGKVFGKINPVTFIDWLGQYADNSLQIREQRQISAANDARYHERWGTHDERQRQRDGDFKLGGEIAHIKENLKNKDDGNNV